MTARALAEHGPGDGELARAARAGDVASLGQLLERYRASLHAAALRMLGHGSAEDAGVGVGGEHRLGDDHRDGLADEAGAIDG